MLSMDPPLANPEEMAIPACVADADQAIARLREHQRAWLRAQKKTEKRRAHPLSLCERVLQLNSQLPPRIKVGANDVVVGGGMNVEAAPPETEQLTRATSHGDDPLVRARFDWGLLQGIQKLG